MSFSIITTGTIVKVAQVYESTICERIAVILNQAAEINDNEAHEHYSCEPMGAPVHDEATPR